MKSIYRAIGFWCWYVYIKNKNNVILDSRYLKEKNWRK